MDQDLINRWLAALRSDKYVQSIGALRNGGGFCCLGVLCDVSTDMGKWEGGQWEKGGPTDYVWLDTHKNHWSGKLPKNLREAAGLSEWDEEKLMEMNDARTSFMDIANYIEQIAKNPEGLA